MSKNKVQQKGKDRIFILVMAIILGNLGYFLAKAIGAVIGDTSQLQMWMLAITNIIAIIAILWLMRSYKMRLRAEKKELIDEQEQEEE